MDDFADKRNLERYLVVPNMFSCISLHSTLGSKPKDYAEYYLMFKLYRVIEIKKKKSFSIHGCHVTPGHTIFLIVFM